MKKKILSIIVAFILCLSPVLLLGGCTEADRGVTFPAGIETGWSVKKDGNFSDCKMTESLASLEIKYKATSTVEKEGYTYNKEKALWEKADEPITVEDAFKQGLLTCVGGFKSDGEVGETFEMTLMFDGETIKATVAIEGTTSSESES